jgi:hypothetical protein
MSLYGIADVVNPLELTYKVVFHQWFMRGSSASRILPTIWVHLCSVSYVSFHSVNGSSGQASLFDEDMYNHVNYLPITVAIRVLKISR